MYEKRLLLDKVLKEYTQDLPAILLEGTKAVGKTETRLQWAKTKYSIDNLASKW